jgi:hypothetical protein
MNTCYSRSHRNEKMINRVKIRKRYKCLDMDVAQPQRVNTGARNGSSNGDALTARMNTGDGRSQPDTDVDMIMQKLAEMEG